MNLATIAVVLSTAVLSSAFAAPAGLREDPLAPASKPAGKTLFTALTAAVTGITVENRMNVDHPMSYLYHSGMTCGGVAVADFDGDGRPDIFFAGTTGPNVLYRNLGGMKFEDITKRSPGLDGGARWSAGAAAADVDGDGDQDLYVCNYERPNQLFINDGKGNFTDLAGAAGLDAVDCSHSAYFADYDGDGRLDVYLLTNRVEDPKGTPSELPVNKKPEGIAEIKPEMERYYHVWRYDYENWGTEAIGTPDRLYHNETKDGQVKFTDVTKAAGISGRGDGLGAVWTDYDRDGRPDIYVANDFLAVDHLYRNKGDGTFEDVLSFAAPHTPWFSMGVDAGDVNNDLLPDILATDMSATSHFKSKTTMGIMGGIDLKRAYFSNPAQYMVNTLLINTGTGRFLEGSKLYGVRSTDWTWTAKFADLDLDGWQDLYFTNGISRHMNDSDKKITQHMLVGKHMFDYFKDGEMRKEKHRGFRNTGRDAFEEVSDAWGLGEMAVTYGAATADLDGDGDLDIVQVNLEEPNRILRNDAQNGHRLAIALTGQKSNRSGIGAEVIISTKSGKQMRQLFPQSGYMSSHEPRIHFGLGADTTVDELVVHWPGGGIQRFTGLKADRLYVITQPGDGGVPVAAPEKIAPMFVENESLQFLKHKDAGWAQDFQRQILLPHAQSQRGPALAWGDVNGDGKPDLYFGKSAGNLGELRVQQANGRFTAQWVEAFRADKAAEDGGAVFFDADGDGDLDLYVASGSNEFQPGAKELQDRLYLGDGKGGFAAAESGAIPVDTENDGPVAAVDYDRDGRVDLFVGAGCVPGDYPRAGRSRLLQNQSTKGSVRFVDVTASVAGLDKAGLVNSALWSDVDADGWPDLLVAVEWGPVQLFRNDKGKLTNATADAGLADRKGWWNSIVSGDFDGDGDLDYAVGNVGLNTKYKQPDHEHPLLAYYADFDGTGKRNMVEVKREGENLFPERGRSCSSDAMPFIKEKFPTFKQFALAKLDQVYEPTTLQKAEKFDATEFQSGVLWNDKGKFTFRPFERIVQIAPIRGMVATDWNGDGRCDLFVAQNFHGPQIENPRYDGGLGDLLLSDGRGGFRRVPHRESGIALRGDMKSATSVDLNADGRPDLAVTRNNDATAAFVTSGGRWLRVGVPAAKAPGARVIFERGSERQVFEYAAGGGYFSQGPASAYFGLGGSSEPGIVKVRLIGGEEMSIPYDGKVPALEVASSVRR